jgi:hypothetical protein
MKLPLGLNSPKIATKKITLAVKIEKDENSEVRLESIFEFALTLYRYELREIANQAKTIYASVTVAL